MRLVTGILIGVLLVGGSAAAIIYSGFYNIAASAPHDPIVGWALETTMEQSVRAHAENVEAPAKFTQAQMQQGLNHFKATCVTCHGGPGTERSEIGKGLTPGAPSLARAARQWDRAELFWIVKHGVKMTGMPAFGRTHSDQELWNIVAFLEYLPQLSPRSYEDMQKVAEDDHHKDGGDQEGHTHNGASHAH